jgi:hypothetical protein
MPPSAHRSSINNHHLVVDTLKVLSFRSVVRAAEMGVLEVIRILETEGEQSVHADVREPQQA